MRVPAVRVLALLMMVLVGAVACSGGHRRGVPPPNTPPSSTTSSTEPSPQFAPSPFSWLRSTAPALAVGGGASATLAAVLAPPLSGPWLVFGSRTNGAGTPASTVWSSPDAVNWSAAALAPANEPSEARAAARYKNTTVAVGCTGTGAAQQAAVWLSPATGAPFAASSVPPSDNPSCMSIVTAGPLGVFAAGTVDGQFSMWSSTDGRQWGELPGAERVIAASPGARVQTMLAEGDNVYAAGSIQAGAVTQPALWSTTDGLNWHLVTSASGSFTGAGDRTIYSLAPLGSGLVAVGAVHKATKWVPASWISPDGNSWSLASFDFESVPAARSGLGSADGTAARSVSAVATLLGSTEVVATGGGPDGQCAWKTSDGLHWTSLPLPSADATATSWRAETAAGTIDTVVVMDSESGQPYLLTDRGLATAAPAPTGWVQPSANPAVFGPIRPDAVPVGLRSVTGRLDLTVDLIARPQTIGPESISHIELASADGRAWQPADLSVGPASLPQPGALAASVPTGWVAVSAQTGPGASTWTSRSGGSWSPGARLSPASPTGSAGTATSTSLAAHQTSLVGIQAVCTGRVRQSAGLVSYRVAAVGAVLTATSTFDVTTQAAAWLYEPGHGWASSTIVPASPLGTAADMDGCAAAGTGFVAYGSAPGQGGAPAPALWQSVDGVTWTRSNVSAFSAGAPNPIVSAAAGGEDWLATSRPDPGPGPTPSIQDGRDALWLSSDGGSTWQAIDPFVDPWLGAQASELYLTGFAGVRGGTPVVIGVIDGRLAAWIGV